MKNIDTCVFENLISGAVKFFDCESKEKLWRLSGRNV